MIAWPCWFSYRLHRCTRIRGAVPVGHVPSHDIYAAVHPPHRCHHCKVTPVVSPCTLGIPTAGRHARGSPGLSDGRRYAMHHAWRHPSSFHFCSLVLANFITKPLAILPRAMLGFTLRRPRTNTQVLEARLGKSTWPNLALACAVSKRESRTRRSLEKASRPRM